MVAPQVRDTTVTARPTEHYLHLRAVPPMIAPEHMLRQMPEALVPRWVSVDDPSGNGTPYFAFTGLAPEHTRSRENPVGLLRSVVPEHMHDAACDGLLTISDATPGAAVPGGTGPYEIFTAHLDHVTAPQFYTYPTTQDRFKVMRAERVGYATHWVRQLTNRTSANTTDLRAAVGAIAATAEDEDAGWVEDCVSWGQRTGMYTRAVRDMEVNKRIQNQARKIAALTCGGTIPQDVSELRMIPNWRTMMTEPHDDEDLKTSHAFGLPYTNGWKSTDADLIYVAVARALEFWFARWYAEHLLVLGTGGRRAFPPDPILRRAVPVSYRGWTDGEFQQIKVRGTRNRKRMMR